MKLDGKVKGGLAWAGLVVILAVPAADIFVGKSDGTTAAAVTTSDAQAVKPALKLPAPKTTIATDPVQTASVKDGEAVDKYIKSGKKLPSYISDGDAVEPAKPAATVNPVAPAGASGSKPETQLAWAPAEEPPVPLPRSARPKTTQVASLPAEEKPLILDENKVQQQDQTAAVDPFPLSDEGQGQVVTGDELEEWDSGSLADYLERKGLMSESTSQASDQYDPDGFYLDEGPNRPRRPKNDLEIFLF